jgi:hypothetical protein
VVSWLGRSACICISNEHPELQPTFNRGPKAGRGHMLGTDPNCDIVLPRGLGMRGKTTSFQYLSGKNHVQNVSPVPATLIAISVSAGSSSNNGGSDCQEFQRLLGVRWREVARRTSFTEATQCDMWMTPSLSCLSPVVIFQAIYNLAGCIDPHHALCRCLGEFMFGVLRTRLERAQCGAL